MSFKDGLVWNGFVSVPGESNAIVACYGESRPAVVNMAIDQELEAKITIGHVGKGAEETAVGVLKEGSHQDAVAIVRGGAELLAAADGNTEKAGSCFSADAANGVALYQRRRVQVESMGPVIPLEMTYGEIRDSVVIEVDVR